MIGAIFPGGAPNENNSGHRGAYLAENIAIVG